MNTVKRKVKQFIKANKLFNITYESLKHTAETNGYTVIMYSSILNNEDVKTIIDNLNLNDIICISKGFTYVNKNYRIIFINEDLNDDEKLLVISHELGHVVCEHFGMQSIIGKDVKEENEANEFSHYLLHPSIFQGFKRNAYRYQKAYVSVLIIITLVLSSIGISSIIATQKSYYGEYYITSTGHKYHKKDCIFVKDKKTVRRLTKDEYDLGKYDPCKICLPDK